MGKEILTNNQKTLLGEFSRQEFIKDFYLTGGTALAAFYLNHRYSEDLDFFTLKEEIDVAGLTIFFESLKSRLNIASIDFEKSLNRNLFFFKIRDDIIKTEFTYFPFERLEEGTWEEKLRVDSVLDIAVNKLFTIYQKPRARDFIDLFFIIKDKNYKIQDLIAKMKLKFDWPIDFLNLGSQMLRAKDLKDYPRIIKELDEKELTDFFINEAKKFGKDVIE